MTKYLVNALSFSMLPRPQLDQAKWYMLRARTLRVEELCEELRGDVVNALGHQATVDMVNALCGTKFSASRIEVKLQPGDKLLLVQVLARLPEGKILSAEELRQLLAEGKVGLYEVAFWLWEW